MTRRVAAALLCGLALGGCAAPRASFAPSREICAAAVPAAVDAVHDKGTLVRVHRLAKGSPVARRYPTSPVCLFVFRGPYPPGAVAGSPKGGRYATVLVTTKHPRVVGVRLGSKP